MKYKILAIREKDVTWKGGIFNKFEVMTNETGIEILELRLGQERNKKTKIGDIIEGYIDTFILKDGKEIKILRGITAEYVYKLLLKIRPDIESL